MVALSPVDDLDRQILQALQADGRASLVDLSREVGVPASTVHRRLSALLAEGRARVVVLPLAHEASVRLYELRVRCQPGTQRDVAQKLTQRHDTRWVAVLTGEYGVAAELAVPAGTEVASVMFDDIEQNDDNIVATQSSLVLHTFKSPLPKGCFPSDPELRLSPADPRTTFDDVDRQVLALLYGDGRRSFASLAADLGVSESTVRRRVNSLLERGGAATVTTVHPGSLGFEHVASLRLDVLPKHLEAVARRLAAHPGVHYLSAVFGETALVCEILMHSPQELYDFLMGTLRPAAGIIRVSVEIELMVVKRAFVATPWTQVKAPIIPLEARTSRR